MPARELTTYERPLPTWPWRLGIFSCALALTAFTALLVPLADLLTKAPSRDLEYRTVELSEWRPPPPTAPVPPPRPVAPPRPSPRSVVRPAPRLDDPARPSNRLRLPVKLDLALSDFRTDLTLDFAADPAAQAIPETASSAPPTPPAPPAPPAAAGPVELRDLDRHPAVLVQTKPIYPYRARTQRLEGYVDLRFTVTVQGRVEDVQVLGAEPRYVFDDAATSAVRRWAFTPGSRAGQPVAARMQIRIRFTLEDS